MISKASAGHWTKLVCTLLIICTLSCAANAQEAKKSWMYDVQYETGINLGIYTSEIAPGVFFTAHKPLWKHNRGEVLAGVFNNLSPFNFLNSELNDYSENFKHSGYQANLQLLHPSFGYRAYFLKRRLNVSMVVNGGYHLYRSRSSLTSDLYDVDVAISITEHHLTGGILASLGYRVGQGKYFNMYLYRDLGDQELINPVFISLGMGWNLFGSKRTGK